MVQLARAGPGGPGLPAGPGPPLGCVQLSRAERAYLFQLAGRRDPASGDPGPADAPASLDTMVHLVADPAYGLDALYTGCCWNGAAARLFADWLVAGRERNLLRFIFLDPAAPRLIPDWAERARRVTAEFRADFGRSANDPRARALVDGLRSESRFFASVWEAQDVLDREGGARSFVHPADGPVSYRQLTFSPADRPDHKLVVLAPLTSARGRCP